MTAAQVPPAARGGPAAQWGAPAPGLPLQPSGAAGHLPPGLPGVRERGLCEAGAAGTSSGEGVSLDFVLTQAIRCLRAHPSLLWPAIIEAVFWWFLKTLALLFSWVLLDLFIGSYMGGGLAAAAMLILPGALAAVGLGFVGGLFLAGWSEMNWEATAGGEGSRIGAREFFRGIGKNGFAFVRSLWVLLLVCGSFLLLAYMGMTVIWSGPGLLLRRPPAGTLLLPVLVFWAVAMGGVLFFTSLWQAVIARGGRGGSFALLRSASLVRDHWPSVAALLALWVLADLVAAVAIWPMRVSALLTGGLAGDTFLTAAALYLFILLEIVGASLLAVVTALFRQALFRLYAHLESPVQ